MEIGIPSKVKRMQCWLPLEVFRFVHTEEGNRREGPAGFDQQLFQCPGTDDSAEHVEQCHVPIADAVQQDHVPDEVGVGLLPKGLFASAPDRGDDRCDIECLGIGVE